MQPRRFHNSLRNSGVALAGQIFNILFGFALRTIFINRLGQEYLGVNGVMESMLTLLSMTELGIGTSVAFALYAPINDDDRPRIGRLMGFYRRTYHAIGALTLVAGLALIPFMRFFTRDVAEVANLNVIYLIFLANTVLSYLFSYKRTLLSAYQAHYVNSLAEDISCFVKYIAQAAVLLLWDSYIGYLLVNLVCVLGANVAISLVCDRRYGFIRAYRREKLDAEDGTLLRRSVVSLLYQKIGAKLVMGTDNLMISYVSIAAMGLYANYTMIIATVTRIAENVTKAIKGSVGNLLVQQDGEHKYRVYEEIVFVEFCFYYIVSVGMAGALQRFIALWAGDDWLLPPTVMAVVILNFFLTGMRQPNILIIEAAGLFNRMRPKAVAEVIVNLVVSLVFLLLLDLGIYGVLFGTTVSMVSVCIWWEALAVHRHAFGVSPRRYALQYLGYLAVAAVGCVLSYVVAGLIPQGGLVGLLLAGCASAAIGALLLLCVYGRTARMHRLLARVRGIRR